MTLTTEEVDMIIENIMQATFHMDDEQAKPVVVGFLKAYPALLDHHDKEFYYKL